MLLVFMYSILKHFFPLFFLYFFQNISVCLDPAFSWTLLRLRFTLRGTHATMRKNKCTTLPNWNADEISLNSPFQWKLGMCVYCSSCSSLFFVFFIDQTQTWLFMFWKPSKPINPKQWNQNHMNQTHVKKKNSNPANPLPINPSTVTEFRSTHQTPYRSTHPPPLSSQIKPIKPTTNQPIKPIADQPIHHHRVPKSRN